MEREALAERIDEGARGLSRANRQRSARPQPSESSKEREALAERGAAGPSVADYSGSLQEAERRSPVISRTRRWSVKYDHAHSVITTIRLRKPISQKMCRKSQKSHAKNPETFRPKMSPTAEPRPIVAMMP